MPAYRSIGEEQAQASSTYVYSGAEITHATAREKFLLGLSSGKEGIAAYFNEGLQELKTYQEQIARQVNAYEMDKFNKAMFTAQPGLKSALANQNDSYFANMEAAAAIASKLQAGEIKVDSQFASSAVFKLMDAHLEAARLSLFSQLEIIAPFAKKGLKSVLSKSETTGEEHIDFIADEMLQGDLSKETVQAYFRWKADFALDNLLKHYSDYQKLEPKEAIGSLYKMRQALDKTISGKPDTKDPRDWVESCFGAMADFSRQCGLFSSKMESIIQRDTFQRAGSQTVVFNQKEIFGVQMPFSFGGFRIPENLRQDILEWNKVLGSIAVVGMGATGGIVGKGIEKIYFSYKAGQQVSEGDVAGGAAFLSALWLGTIAQAIPKLGTATAIAKGTLGFAGQAASGYMMYGMGRSLVFTVDDIKKFGFSNAEIASLAEQGVFTFVGAKSEPKGHLKGLKVTKVDLSKNVHEGMPNAEAAEPEISKDVPVRTKLPTIQFVEVTAKKRRAKSGRELQYGKVVEQVEERLGQGNYGRQKPHEPTFSYASYLSDEPQELKKSEGATNRGARREGSAKFNAISASIAENPLGATWGQMNELLSGQGDMPATALGKLIHENPDFFKPHLTDLFELAKTSQKAQLVLGVLIQTNAFSFGRAEILQMLDGAGSSEFLSTSIRMMSEQNPHAFRPVDIPKLLGIASSSSEGIAAEIHGALGNIIEQNPGLFSKEDVEDIGNKAFKDPRRFMPLLLQLDRESETDKLLRSAIGKSAISSIRSLLGKSEEAGKEVAREIFTDKSSVSAESKLALFGHSKLFEPLKKLPEYTRFDVLSAWFSENGERLKPTMKTGEFEIWLDECMKNRVESNLAAFNELESTRPGAAQALNLERHIRFFGRWGPKLLSEQYDRMLELASGAGTKKSQTMAVVLAVADNNDILFSARDDAENFFKPMKGMLEKVKSAVAADGIDFAIAEAKDKNELKTELENIALTQGPIGAAILGAHGSDAKMRFGYGEGGLFLPSDFAHLGISKNFTKNPSLLFFSCMTGQPESLVHSIGWMFPNATFYAPNESTMLLDLNYTGLKSGKPTFEPVWAQPWHAMVFNPPSGQKEEKPPITMPTETPEEEIKWEYKKPTREYNPYRNVVAFNMEGKAMSKLQSVMSTDQKIKDKISEPFPQDTPEMQERELDLAKGHGKEAGMGLMKYKYQLKSRDQLPHELRKEINSMITQVCDFYTTLIDGVESRNPNSTHAKLSRGAVEHLGKALNQAAGRIERDLEAQWDELAARYRDPEELERQKALAYLKATAIFSKEFDAATKPGPHRYSMVNIADDVSKYAPQAKTFNELLHLVHSSVVDNLYAILGTYGAKEGTMPGNISSDVISIGVQSPDYNAVVKALSGSLPNECNILAIESNGMLEIEVRNHENPIKVSISQTLPGNYEVRYHIGVTYSASELEGLPGEIKLNNGKADGFVGVQGGGNLSGTVVDLLEKAPTYESYYDKGTGCRIDRRAGLPYYGEQAPQKWVSEGLAELLASQQKSKESAQMAPSDYPLELQMFYFASQIAGEEADRRAYFSGNYDWLAAKLDMALGRFFFDTWTAFENTREAHEFFMEALADAQDAGRIKLKPWNDADIGLNFR